MSLNGAPRNVLLETRREAHWVPASEPALSSPVCAPRPSICLNWCEFEAWDAAVPTPANTLR